MGDEDIPRLLRGHSRGFYVLWALLQLLFTSSAYSNLASGVTFESTAGVIGAVAGWLFFPLLLALFIYYVLGWPFRKLGAKIDAATGDPEDHAARKK